MLTGGTRKPEKEYLTGGIWPMDESSDKGNKGLETSVSKAVESYVAGLSNEHRMLVILKAQLYDGTWATMLDDLQNRLSGKPYIFKLANRIKEDIERIEQMQKFEKEHNVDLADYVELS
ncbi:MAG: hypothetical protein A2Z25_13985 [Planctomycetes bacterium RBG_16_55_9]|nr:MAG: hypothetical protein A2Z25_13985 [Planctomycetes bacterium RBG_16_55_9]